MATGTLIDSPLWKQFEEEARRQGADPVDLVTTYMNECLEVWEDEALDDEISRDVQKSGYEEGDAVKIVRRYRQEKERACLDPDDNLVLATAIAGKAEYVVTNDRDLLDIPASVRKKFRFSIVTPAQLLIELEEKAKV